MYINHALINALSTHIIHINLNTIFYTHIEESYLCTYIVSLCLYILSLCHYILSLCLYFHSTLALHLLCPISALLCPYILSVLSLH